MSTNLKFADEPNWEFIQVDLMARDGAGRYRWPSSSSLVLLSSRWRLAVVTGGYCSIDPRIVTMYSRIVAVYTCSRIVTTYTMVIPGYITGSMFNHIAGIGNNYSFLIPKPKWGCRELLELTKRSKNPDMNYCILNFFGLKTKIRSNSVDHISLNHVLLQW